MRKTILCLLLLVVLFVAASGQYRRRWNRRWPIHRRFRGHWGLHRRPWRRFWPLHRPDFFRPLPPPPPPPPPPFPVGRLQRCCGYPYIPFIMALYKRPGNWKFNKFLRLSLRFAWLMRRSRGGFGWRLKRRALRLRKVLIHKFRHYWFSSSPVKELRQFIITGARGFEAHLEKQWLGKKAHPKTLVHLKWKCRIMRAGRLCGQKAENCWWWDLCNALLKPKPTTTCAPTTTTSSPTTTNNTTTTPPTTTTNTPITTATYATNTTLSTTAAPTTTACVPAALPSFPSSRLAQYCSNNTDCPLKFWRWIYSVSDKFRVLCEENVTCLNDTSTPKCVDTQIVIKNNCSEFVENGVTRVFCGTSPKPIVPGCAFQYYSYAFRLNRKEKVCALPGTLYSGCEWKVIEEVSLRRCG